MTVLAHNPCCDPVCNLRPRIDATARSNRPHPHSFRLMIGLSLDYTSNVTDGLLFSRRSSGSCLDSRVIWTTSMPEAQVKSRNMVKDVEGLGRACRPFLISRSAEHGSGTTTLRADLAWILLTRMKEYTKTSPRSVESKIAILVGIHTQFILNMNKHE